MIRYSLITCCVLLISLTSFTQKNAVDFYKNKGFEGFEIGSVFVPDTNWGVIDKHKSHFDKRIVGYHFIDNYNLPIIFFGMAIDGISVHTKKNKKIERVSISFESTDSIQNSNNYLNLKEVFGAETRLSDTSREGRQSIMVWWYKRKVTVSADYSTDPKNKKYSFSFSYSKTDAADRFYWKKAQ